MAGVRFEDVDLLGALSRIVDLHTQHYKEDFDLDKELISKLAVSDRSEDKQLLWMSRPCGTYTLREREVYLDGSHENKVWRFYQEQTNDPVLAYAISLKEVRDGKIFGNLYPLNYREHVERMKKLTCPIGNVAVAFADGNGRTARLMSGYILDYYGYGFNGIGSLEEYFAYDPDEYYASLQMGLPALYYSGRENPPHPEIWINYFLRMMVLYSKKVYELSKESENDELDGSLSYLNAKEKEFLAFLLKKRLYEFTPIEVSKMLGVTNKTIINRCAKLVNNGLLIPIIVKTRIRSYRLSDFSKTNEKKILKKIS